MTRKHFNAIAKLLYTNKNESYGNLIDAFADYLATENANFDRDRFFNACSNGR